MRYQLFIFSLLYSIFSFGQSIEATYSHKFNDNLHNLDIKKDSIITIESKPIKYNYSYSKNKSIYKLSEAEISKKDSIKNYKTELLLPPHYILIFKQITLKSKGL